MWEISSKLTIKTPERRQWHRCVVIIVNFEEISYIAFVFAIVDFEQVNTGQVEYWIVRFSATIVKKIKP